MSMTITLELPPDLEAQLREGIARHDAERIYRLLVKAFIPTVENLLNQTSDLTDNEEFETVADQLADELTAYFKVAPPVLSDYAVSRASMYEDHA